MNSESSYILSDNRIKECICDVHGLLDKLDKINFVSYNLKGNPNSSYDVGVIAQNVAEIFPSMILYRPEYIPSVNKQIVHTSIDDIISITLDNASSIFNVNDNILLIKQNDKLQEKSIQTKITVVNDNSIEIAKWSDYSSDDIITLYGKKVDDLHLVDKTQISILGAACAKELYQIVQEQSRMIKVLQDQVAALQAK